MFPGDISVFVVNDGHPAAAVGIVPAEGGAIAGIHVHFGQIEEPLCADGIVTHQAMARAILALVTTSRRPSHIFSLEITHDAPMVGKKPKRLLEEKRSLPL